jgi:preprotein translocase subunit SecY
MTNPHPPQNANESGTTSPHNPPGRWARLAFTILALFVYLLAERIPLPNLGDLKYAGSSPETYNILAVGILPWIIAAVMVEVFAMVVPPWQHLRHDVVFGRAKLRRATNIVGLLFAVVHASWIALTLIFTPRMYDLNKHEHVPGLAPRPYAESPMLVLVTLVVGAIFVRLLAEVVSRRGLTNGYVVIFGGELLLSTLRTIIRDNQNPDWMNTLQLSWNLLAGTALTLFILAKLRSRQGATASDRPKSEPFEDGGNPYASPNAD